jgi:TPR repeat protein
MIKAREFFANACDWGYAPECFNLGVMHRDGIATPKNEPFAQALFRRGCDLGYQAACEALRKLSAGK